jgi:hypothetical protein
MRDGLDAHDRARDLVEQRLEEVVVAAVDQRHLDRRRASARAAPTPPIPPPTTTTRGLGWPATDASGAGVAEVGSFRPTRLKALAGRLPTRTCSFRNTKVHRRTRGEESGATLIRLRRTTQPPARGSRRRGLRLVGAPHCDGIAARGEARAQASPSRSSTSGGLHAGAPEEKAAHAESGRYGDCVQPEREHEEDDRATICTSLASTSARPPRARLGTHRRGSAVARRAGSTSSRLVLARQGRRLRAVSVAEAG